MMTAERRESSCIPGGNRYSLSSLFEELDRHTQAQPLLPSPVSVLIILFVCFLIHRKVNSRRAQPTAALFTAELPVPRTVPDTVSAQSRFLGCMNTRGFAGSSYPFMYPFEEHVLCVCWGSGSHQPEELLFCSEELPAWWWNAGDTSCV